MIAAQRRGVARRKCATSTGIARRMCVYDGISACPARSAWSASAATSARRLACKQRDAAAQIEPQIERHLLVARSPGVQPAPGVADALDQLPLDEAVDVLVGDRRPTPDCGAPPRGWRRAPSRIAGASSGPSARRRATSASAHARLPVTSSSNSRRSKRKRDAEIERRGIRRGVEPARPEVLGHHVA